MFWSNSLNNNAMNQFNASSSGIRMLVFSYRYFSGRDSTGFRKIGESKRLNECAFLGGPTTSGNHSAGSSVANASMSREPRRKKVPKVSDLEAELAALEKENLELKLQLKLGVETSERIAQDKQDILAKMNYLVTNNAPEVEVDNLIREYVDKFSDYGRDRAECYNRHMKQLESLLKPTQVSKMCMWSLHQDDDFYKTEEQEKAMLEKKGINSNIWSIVCDVIGATEEQKEKIKLHRDDAKKVAKDLRFTLRECEDLKQRMERKNAALLEEMKELRKILTPIQLAKFIIWVNENKASMAMLDKLWNPVDELHKVSG